MARQLTLPRHAATGVAIGGFSAAHWTPADNSLLLLSDLPSGAVTRWGGLATGGTPRLLELTPLRSGPHRALPTAMDGEGLVPLAGQWWVASEGRRSAERPAQLLRFATPDGTLLGAWELPAPWQPGEGRGLASNGGPEALMLLPSLNRGESPSLLMAAELPLLQDPPGQVRLLRWGWSAGDDPATATPRPTPQGALELPPGEGWGLTDLLATGPGRLLGLLRRFELPNRWQIRLALYPLPAAGSLDAAAPLATWDLIAIGLEPDNWEALSPGPPLADGRPTLLLASDDNLSPLQANRLALLTPRRPARSTGPCP
ncbi:MAG: esterase-like activity of phytase family protein [Cyanobacteriota bacterium]